MSFESMKYPFAVLLLSLPALCLAAETRPPCSDEGLARPALTAVRNNDILSLDYDMTKTKTVRFASETIDEHDDDGKPMWRGVYQITFEENNGDKVKVVAVYRIGEPGCSIYDQEYLIVSKHLHYGAPAYRYRQID